VLDGLEERLEPAVEGLVRAPTGVPRDSVERLEERVRTLERIVTDDSNRLRHKFDEIE